MVQAKMVKSKCRTSEVPPVRHCSALDLRSVGSTLAKDEFKASTLNVAKVFLGLNNVCVCPLPT